MDPTSDITPAITPPSWVASGTVSFDTMVKSGQIWAAACKKLADITTETVTGYCTQTADAWKAMGQIKTVKEAVELQSTYLRNTTEHSVVGAKKLIDMTSELTRDVMASAKLERLPTLSPASVSIT